MVLNYISYILVSSLSALLGYYLTNNFNYLLAILLIYLLFFFSYEFIYKRKNRIRRFQKDDLNTFMHDFLISFAINHDVARAIKDGAIYTSKFLNEQIGLLEEYKPIDKLDGLANYFNSNLYFLLVETVKLSDNPKDYVNVLSFLQLENNHLIDRQNKFRKSQKRSLFEFAILWIAVFLVLSLLRLALNNYFNKFSNNLVYLGSIIVLFAFLLLSIYLFDTYSAKGEKLYE